MKTLFAAVALVAATTTASAQSVNVTLSEFKIVAKPDSVKAGRVLFQVTNSGATSHQLQVKGGDVDKTTAVINAKQAGSLSLVLKAGEYELICPMADGTHKAGGMVTKLKVYAPAAAPPAKKKP